jgi:hypothetical protein
VLRAGEDDVATTLAGKPLVEASWGLLRRDPSMIVLLLVGGLSASVAFALVALPASLVLGVPTDGRGGPANIVVYAIALFASTLVSTFFLGAVVAAAMERADGGDPTFSSAMAAAWERRSQLIAWAALSTAVGVALRLLERFGIAGTIMRLLAGVSWAVATWFAIPVIMAEGTMPIETIRRSSHILTSRFGSNVRATVRLGLIFLGLGLVLFVVGFVGLLAAFDGAKAHNTATLMTGVLLIVAAIVGGFVVSAVGQAVGAYLRTVLYRYASGLPTPGIDPRVLPPMLALAPAYDGARFGAPAPQPYTAPSGRHSHGAPQAPTYTYSTDPAVQQPYPPIAPTYSAPAVPTYAHDAAPQQPAPPSAPIYSAPAVPTYGNGDAPRQPAPPSAPTYSAPAAPPAAPPAPAAPGAAPLFVEPLAPPARGFDADPASGLVPGIPPAPRPSTPPARPAAPPASGSAADDPASAAAPGVFLPEPPEA